MDACDLLERLVDLGDLRIEKNHYEGGYEFYCLGHRKEVGRITEAKLLDIIVEFSREIKEDPK